MSVHCSLLLFPLARGYKVEANQSYGNTQLTHLYSFGVSLIYSSYLVRSTMYSNAESDRILAVSDAAKQPPNHVTSDVVVREVTNILVWGSKFLMAHPNILPDDTPRDLVQEIQQFAILIRSVARLSYHLPV